MAEEFDQLVYRLRSFCSIGAPSDHDTMEEAADEIERFHTGKYLIWSNEHSAWWRAKSQGYTSRLELAGHYDRIEALQICGMGRDGWKDVGAPDEIPVRVEDAEVCSTMFAAKRMRNADVNTG